MHLISTGGEPVALKPGLAVPPILRPRRRVSGALQRGMCGHVLIIEDEILIAFVLEDELRVSPVSATGTDLRL